jgi:Ni/Co efflux regulator RcnB
VCIGTVEEQRKREEGNEAMSLWRRIVVLVVAASVMAFMSAPAAWAGDFGNDHGKDKEHHADKDHKDHGKKDDDDKDHGKKDDDDKDHDDKDKKH